MAKSNDVKKTFIKAGLAGQGCDFRNLTAYGGARLGGKPPIIAQVADGWKPRILPADAQFGQVIKGAIDGHRDGNRPLFVAIRRAVMLEGDCVAVAKSKTFAKRIANALNNHVPNREGV